MNAREDFEREIVVKVNVPEVVRAELRRSSWKGEHVALGTNTDPYQWVEGRYRLMEGIWEAMRDFANPCSVLTKSPLLLRDLELMKQVSARTEFVANLSIPTLEEKAWRATEPHTPHPRKRIEAVAELSRAGIPTGVLIAPLIPGVNDAPGQVEELAQAVGEAGARERRRASGCTCGARCARSGSTGCASTGPTSCRATSGCIAGAHTCPPRSASSSRLGRAARAGRGGSRARAAPACAGPAGGRRLRSVKAVPRNRRAPGESVLIAR